MATKLKRTIRQCNRCGYAWPSRMEREPNRCPGCGSPLWNKPRVYNRGPKAKYNEIPIIKTIDYLTPDNFDKLLTVSESYIWEQINFGDPEKKKYYEMLRIVLKELPEIRDMLDRQIIGERGDITINIVNPDDKFTEQEFKQFESDINARLEGETNQAVIESYKNRIEEARKRIVKGK